MRKTSKRTRDSLTRLLLICRNQRDLFHSKSRRPIIVLRISLVLTMLSFVAFLPGEAGAVKIYEPNDYEPVCLSWYDHTAHLADSDASCNPKTGYVGTYANAWAGAGTAEAQQKVIVTVSDPNNTNRTIFVDVEIWHAGGAKTFGYGGFAGTEKTWAVGNLDNYHRRDVDEWLTYEIAIGKLVDILLLGSGGGSEILGALSNIKTGYDLGNLFFDLWLEGDAEVLHITFDYEVPAGVTTVPIWAGLRSTASACITGWGDAISVGQVRRFIVYNVDPPDPPVVAGPARAIVEEPVQFSFTNPLSNGEFVKIWIDWGDTAPLDPELTNGVGPGKTLDLNHTYAETGQYTINVKAVAADDSSSAYVTHLIFVCPAAPTGVSASDGEFTDRIRVTWNSMNGADEYRVHRAISPNAPPRILGRWQEETLYDDSSNRRTDTYYYWVEARKNRLLFSEYSAEADTGWQSVLGPDLNQDGFIDMNDVIIICNYWLESGSNISGDITHEEELVNLRHLAVVTWAMGDEVSQDLVTDGSFEVDDNIDGCPDYWNVPSDPCCGGRAILDITTSLAGSASLMVEPCVGIAYCEQYLIIDPSNDYTLSGWMKTSDVNGAGLFIAYEQLVGEQWNVVGCTANDRVFGTTDWVQRSVTFRSQDEITDGRVVCHFGDMAGGIGWFDCVRLESADTVPPGVPQSLRVESVTNEAVSLSWDPSIDNESGIGGYKVYCDGYLVGSTGKTGYIDSGLNRSTTYSYTVCSFDRAENHSSQSGSVLAVTDPGPNLVSNGSFESGLTGWTYYAGASCDRTTPAYCGSASMHVVPSGENVIASQELDVLGRTWYTLSAWIKTNGAYPVVSPLFIAYEEWDGVDWVPAALTIDDPVPGTTDWVQRSVTFRTFAESERGRVVLCWSIVFGEGWFDDVKLTVAE